LKFLSTTKPEAAAALTKKINAIILNGRTTPSKKQSNDSGDWKDSLWMGP
jgi:hypothetical protein